MAFSPNGKLVVSGSHDHTVRVWDAATGSSLYTLEGHSDWVNAVAFSADGKLVASGSDDSTVRLWDTARGMLWDTLKADETVHEVAFSPDGSHLRTDRTDRGILRSSLLLANSPQHFCDSPTEAYVHERWIAFRNQRTLWLPPEYTTTCTAVWKSTAVLGHYSGRVTFIAFDTGGATQV